MSITGEKVDKKLIAYLIDLKRWTCSFSMSFFNHDKGVNIMKETDISTFRYKYMNASHLIGADDPMQDHVTELKC